MLLHFCFSRSRPSTDHYHTAVAIDAYPYYDCFEKKTKDEESEKKTNPNKHDYNNIVQITFIINCDD